MTDQTDQPSEKKIFIDEDWKSRVQAEKEQAEEEQAAKEQPQHESTDAASTPPSADIPDSPLPPPSLAMLATTLGMQAMAALGVAPDPLTGKTEARLNQARHLIDMIQMLQEKTQGNRTPEETTILDSLLHELRMGYVAVAQHTPPASPAAGD